MLTTEKNIEKLDAYMLHSKSAIVDSTDANAIYCANCLQDSICPFFTVAPESCGSINMTSNSSELPRTRLS